MKIKPLHDRVLIKRSEQKETSEGGILLPENAKEKPYSGKVLAVGPGRRGSNGELIAMSVKEGDKVVFSQYASNSIIVDNEELLLISESDIYGIES